jgi:outer membrane receptor protein involved in Fe transport
VAKGNEGLKEESLTAYELGYIGQFGRTTLGAAVYLNHSRNMIQFTEAPGQEYYSSGHPPPGWPLQLAVLDQLVKEGHPLPWTSTYLNFKRISDHGIELSADTHLTRAVSAFANYTWQADPTPSGFAVEELNTPATHRLNAGATVNHNRYFGSLTGSFVDGAYWQDVLAPYRGVTAAYTLMDASLGLHSTDGMMTFAVRGSNLLNKPVPQHVFGDIITRTITGEVRVGF